MRYIICICVILVAVYWSEVTDFVSGNAHQANVAIKTWLVNHTPKHE